MRISALACFALMVLSLRPAAAQSPIDCDNCGRVQSIRTAAAEATDWRPLGTVSASALGGDVGSPQRTTTALSFSRDSSPSMVTIGAAGGVAYGKRPASYQRPRWEIVVRMDKGEPRTIQTDYDPLLEVGDRVRVYGTQLERMTQP